MFVNRLKITFGPLTTPILSNTNENKDFGHVLYLFGGRENFIIAHNE